ncbi:MAG: hypothetical protein ACTHJ3_15025 [Pararhizobium sp.]
MASPRLACAGRIAEEAAGSLVWAAAMAAVVFLDLGRINGRIEGHLGILLVIYAAGGAIALPVASLLMRAAAGTRHPLARLLAAFVVLALVTIAATALVYLLRDFVRIVHPRDVVRPHVLFDRALDLAFTLAEFCVLGIRLYFPYGLAALLAGAAWLARRSR